MRFPITRSHRSVCCKDDRGTVKVNRKQQNLKYHTWSTQDITRIWFNRANLIGDKKLSRRLRKHRAVSVHTARLPFVVYSL